MKRTIIAILAVGILTSASYQKSAPGGSWTFKSVHALANKFLPHGYSLTALDTTKNQQPKLIVDFFGKLPTASGKYNIVKGAPNKEDEVSIGVGFMKGTFYSSTGVNGKQAVNVVVSNGKVSISGSAIPMAAQGNAKDIAPLTFNISYTP